MYDLNWQNFTLSRQLVQLSVSGVEQEVLEKVRDWLVPTGAKSVVDAVCLVYFYLEVG